MSFSPPDSRSPAGSTARTVEVTLPELGAAAIEATVAGWEKHPGEWVERDEPICIVSAQGLRAAVASSASGHVVRLMVEVGARINAGTSLAEIALPEAEPEEARARPPAEWRPASTEAPDPTAKREAPPEEAPEPKLDPTAKAETPSRSEEAPDPTAKREAPPEAAPDPTRAPRTLPPPSRPQTTARETAEATPDFGFRAEHAYPKGRRFDSRPPTDDGPPPAEAIEDREALVPRRDGPLAPAPERRRLEKLSLHSRGVRRLAAARGVDLSLVRGTGIGGRVRREDVVAHLEASPASPDQTPRGDDGADERRPEGGRDEAPGRDGGSDEAPGRDGGR